MRPFLLILMILVYAPVKPCLCQSFRLTVNITGLRNDKGKIYLSLYNSEKGYPKEPSAAYRLTYADIHGGKSIVQLTDIAPGTYAIACFHDENDNRKLDA